MRQSQLFTKTIKEAPKDEVSLNARLLIRAGFADKLMAGVYTLLPLGWRVYKKIEHIIKEEMDRCGAQEVYMPTLQPKENWQTTGRFDDLDILFRFVSYNTKSDYVLGPTHEEVISPLVKKHVSSYKDLPAAIYHIQNKFRDEKRAKSGLLRGREFMMKDLYSFHAGQEDLDRFYDTIDRAYIKIYDRCGIGGITYKTFASGGTFSKYSHEYQTLTPAGEDIIYICDVCKIAVNKEIIGELEHKCPECGNDRLREEKAVEVGNIFKLGSKYSEPFGLVFTDEKGEKQPVLMGCYGIGLQRLMGTIVEARNDDRGIIWPEAAAPFKVHLLSLNKNQESGKIYTDLSEAGIEVLYDDREDMGAGQKFADADLIGCPYRAVVSEKTLQDNSVEVKKRGVSQVEMVGIDNIVKILAK